MKYGVKCSLYGKIWARNNMIIAIAYTSDTARKKAIAIGNSFYAFD